MIPSRETMQVLLKRSGNSCEHCGESNDIGPKSRPGRLFVVAVFEDSQDHPDDYTVRCARCREETLDFLPTRERVQGLTFSGEASWEEG